MSKHEEKACPRCGGGFTCKVGDITQCQCYGIQLSAEEEAYIAGQYNDCLCRNCLLQLQQRYFMFKEQQHLYGNR